MRLLFGIVCLALIMISCDSDKKASSQQSSTVAKEQVKDAQNLSSKDAKSIARDEVSSEISNQKAQLKANNVKSPQKPKAAVVVANYDKDIPDACSLITEDQVETIFGLPKGSVALKDGSSPQATKSRACFFRWETDANPNAGILIQVQKNPVPEEYAEWPTLFIESKIEGGEQTFDGSGISYKFEKWDEAGDAGCFSYEAGKYHWRIADDYLILLAFNTNNNKKSQMAAAKSISGIVMSNM